MSNNGTENLSTKLANKLQKEIQAGTYIPGAKLPSERELSDTYNLARNTVRRAIEILAEEGIVHRRAGAGTFVGEVNRIQSLNSSLGLIVPTMANPYYGEFLNAVENFANKRGYQILVGQSDYTYAKETEYLRRYADEYGVEGVLVVPNIDEVGVGAYQYLVQQNKPFVFAGRWPEQVEADAVSSDYRRGAKQIVSYLIGLGHTKIAYIEGHPHFPESPLLKGYAEALLEANIPEAAERILLVNAPADQAGSIGVNQLVENNVEFTAVFARNDLTASGVYHGLAHAGLRVPDHVSVVGFDSTMISKHLQPSLTTVDTTLHEIGRQAAMMLFDRIEGIYDGPPRRTLIEPTLIIRDSCIPLT